MKIVVVGAIYQDIILHLTEFPVEDSKTRAKDIEYRRGGNSGNTLEVLSQFNITNKQLNNNAVVNAISGSRNGEDDQSDNVSCKLPLDLEFIGAVAGTRERPSELAMNFNALNIQIKNAIFRGDNGIKDPNAWIISTGNSRTIINHNPLSDIQFDEFNACFKSILNDIYLNLQSQQRNWDNIPLQRKQKINHEQHIDWTHFEGRNPENLIPFLKSLSNDDVHIRSGTTNTSVLKNENLVLYRNQLDIISIEVEKPGKPELKKLIQFADICFFSFVFCKDEGFQDYPAQFLVEMARKYTVITATTTTVTATSAANLSDSGLVDHIGKRKRPIFIVTAGAQGAFYLSNASIDSDISQARHVPAPEIVALDTVGAGDTFIAGFILSFGYLKKPVHESVEFAVQLASKKCRQQGFKFLFP